MTKDHTPWIPLNERGSLPIPWEKFKVKMIPDEIPLSNNWTDDVNLINPYTDTELDKMHQELKRIIIYAHAPPSTRWRRNYTDRAEWFFLWSEKHKKDDLLHAYSLSFPYPQIEEEREFFSKKIADYFYGEK